MGAGYGDRARRSDKIFINIVRHQCHIGAVIAVENQRKGLFIFDAQNHQSGQTLLIGNQSVGITPYAIQLFAQKAAVMLIADARQHR